LWSDLKFGAVVFYKDFQFPDGGIADKLFVVLGLRDLYAFIALATSVPPVPDITPGSHPHRSLFRLQKNARNNLDKDTYVLLHRLAELTPVEVASSGWNTNAKVVLVLPEQEAHAVKNCAGQTPDLSPRQQALLGPPPAPKREKP
jgi:hypothetical protein